MLVVISPEDHFTDEVKCLDEMHAQASFMYHFRKPNWSKAACAQFLESLPDHLKAKCMIHQYHEQAAAFSLRGVHYKSNMLHIDADLAYKSAAMHSKEEIQLKGDFFDYVLLSPVFHSISKPNYDGRSYHVHELDAQIIALSGIQPDNAGHCAAMGFKGIASLGYIWKAQNPTHAFSRLYDEYQKHFL